jgi:hypothetical protein
VNLEEITKSLATTLLDVLSTHIREIGTQPVVVLHQETAIELIKVTLFESIKAVQAKCESARNEQQALEEATCCKCGKSYSTAGMRKLSEDFSICLLCDVQPIPFVPVDTSPSDDDQPVSEEWLISVGLYKKPTSYRESAIDVRLSLVIGLSTGSLHPGRRKARLSKWTRGNVRLVCGMLGIKLSEASVQEADLVDCVDCNGTGTIINTFVDNEDETFAYNQVIECDRCKGSKRIPKEQLDWIENGKRLREFRTRGGSGKGFQNLVQFAEKYGYSVAELSRMEHGKLKIPAKIWNDVITGGDVIKGQS